MKKILTATALALTLATSAHAEWTHSTFTVTGKYYELDSNSVVINKQQNTRSMWIKIQGDQPETYSVFRVEHHCPTRMRRIIQGVLYSTQGQVIHVYSNFQNWSYTVPGSMGELEANFICSVQQN